VFIGEKAIGKSMKFLVATLSRVKILAIFFLED
jgi:hypothetical protein